MKFNFEKSPYADSIYYADLFCINKKNWMIMGHGKSEAARIANNKDKAKDFSRDSTAIALDDNILKGRYDAGAINLDLEESKRNNLHKFHEIHYIAYCLSEDDTKQIFSTKLPSIIECQIELMSQYSTIFPYSAVTAPYVFSEKELCELQNRERRQRKFYELVKGAKGIKLLLVPFMPTVNEKAKLYNEYL